MEKKTEQVNVRIPKSEKDILIEIGENHGLTEQVLIRAYVKEVVAYYKEHGRFSLPITVKPVESKKADRE